jgi:hypothetical protein
VEPPLELPIPPVALPPLELAPPAALVPPVGPPELPELEMLPAAPDAPPLPGLPLPPAVTTPPVGAPPVADVPLPPVPTLASFSELEHASTDAKTTTEAKGAGQAPTRFAMGGLAMDGTLYSEEGVVRYVVSGSREIA